MGWGSKILADWSRLISQSLSSVRTFEAVTVAVAGALGVLTSLAVAPLARGIMGGGLAVLMIAIAAVDARRFIIPDEFTAAAIVLGFLNAAFESANLVIEALAYAALRGAILAFVFFGLRELYRRIRRREGIGLGDVKLAGVAGVWLDWSMIPIAIEIAALAALAVYTARLFYKGRSIRSTARLPFGAFFAPAIWVGWLVESVLFSIPSASALP